MKPPRTCGDSSLSAYQWVFMAVGLAWPLDWLDWLDCLGHYAPPDVDAIPGSEQEGQDRLRGVTAFEHRANDSETPARAAVRELAASTALQTPSSPYAPFAPDVGMGRPDPTALLDWVDDIGPAASRVAGGNLLGFGQQSSAPIQLNPNAPRKPVAPLPLTNEDDLKAHADRATAERLLTSKDLMSGARATEAMELLVSVPAAQRAKVIDGLDDTAFENLLDRVPEGDRERFDALVESSTNPKRKVRLWAEFHKSRANNDIAKHKGDVGKKGSRTDEQKQTLREHKRRETAAETTNTEVDVEVTELLERAKSGTLTLSEVDEMRTRKDLEYGIELEHNLNITAEAEPRPDGSRVAWSTPELEQVQASLSQLPHLQGKKAFERIERAQSKNGETKGGQFFGDHIKIYDKAMTPAEGYSKNEPRTNVPDELRRKHGDMIGALEYTLTHEIGHGAEANKPEAFKKFKESAGWGADGKGGSPEIPTEEETGSRRWEYARGNAQEHFAEVYAKAVHAPEKVHADLVENPTRIATDARADVNQRRAAIARLKADPSADPAQLSAMSAELEPLEGEALAAENTAKQRTQQFNIMRNDVFGTDKAVGAAVSRLRVRNVGDDAIAEFEKNAAKVSTPDQVAALEQGVKR